MAENLENSTVATRLEKVSFHSNPKERQFQNCSTYRTVALISQTSKVMLKILPVRLQSMWTMNFQMFKLDLEKAGEQASVGSSKKQESSRKTSASLLTTPKPLTMWITTNCERFFKRWEYQTTWPASWEICMQVKKQQLEQRTGSKLGKEYTSRLYIVTLLI